MTAPLFSGFVPNLPAFADVFPSIGTPWLVPPAPALEPLAARASATDLPVLKAREVSFGEPDRAARAWVLSGAGTAVVAGRQPVVFFETSTPGATAAAHAQWLSWQREALLKGHATYCVVLAHQGATAGDDDEVCRALNACLKDARQAQAAVVLRFDAAASVVPCLLAQPQRVTELVLGPLPLWPLPSSPQGVHPLTTLHTLLGWMDNGSFNAVSKAVWQLLDHPLAASTAPALLQAAVWQEQLARASLPGEASAHTLAVSLGPWLVPGMASVLADDWALRRVSVAEVRAAWPVRAVFAAEDAEPARAWAQDYVRGLLGAFGEAARVVMGAELGLPLSAPKALAKPVATVVQKPAVQKAVAKKAVAKAPAKPRVAAKPDDLKIIEGIGPQIAKLLNQDGITTFEGLSRAPVARLQKVLAAAGPRFAMAKPGTWPKQAGLLARGQKAAFEALTRRLRGGVAV